jgi:hypothetical protein
VLFSSVTIHTGCWRRRGRDNVAGSVLYKNAGFDPEGRVAEGLGLTYANGGRYRVEEKLSSLLDAQHLDDPEKLELPWEWNLKWNIQLIIYTLIVAFVSLTPYIHLIMVQFPSNPAFKIGLSAWVFPLLRSFGSAGVTIISQILLQIRITSILKDRLVFMTLDKRVKMRDDKRWRPRKGDRYTESFAWDSNLVAQDCISDLEKFLEWQLLSPKGSKVTEKLTYEQVHSNDQLLSLLRNLRAEHMNSLLHWLPRAIIQALQFILFVCILSIIAGYIGCFSLVRNSGDSLFGPLLWITLESVLSAVRMLLWAIDPEWDNPPPLWLTVKRDQNVPNTLCSQLKSSKSCHWLWRTISIWKGPSHESILPTSNASFNLTYLSSEPTGKGNENSDTYAGQDKLGDRNPIGIKWSVELVSSPVDDTEEVDLSPQPDTEHRANGDRNNATQRLEQISKAEDLKAGVEVSIRELSVARVARA